MLAGGHVFVVIHHGLQRRFATLFQGTASTISMTIHKVNFDDLMSRLGRYRSDEALALGNWRKAAS